MSIQSEITRLANAKTALATAIEGKGVTVPEGTKLDGLAALVESIEAGGGGSVSNIAHGDFTNNLSYDMTAFAVMTQDEWEAAYGNFPDSFFGAFFDINADDITSGTFPLFAASATINGTDITSYMTVYANSQILSHKKTTAIAQLNNNLKKVQIFSDPAYSFRIGRTYKWVILW